MMTNKKGDKMKFNYKKTFMFGLVFFSISVLNSLHDSITPKILNGVFGLNQTSIGAVMAIDNILALILLPIIGFISDRTSSKMGKRKPFIFFGTIASAILLIMLPLAAGAKSLALFVVCVTLLLIALSTYRAPGVSLLSDFTIKPHRSLGNGVI
ncbi:MAG: MFS transporter, partial [Clostridia bacterium]